VSKIVGIIVSMALVAAAIHYADQAVSANRATSYVCGYLEGQRAILLDFGMDGTNKSQPEQPECVAEHLNAKKYGF